MSIKSRTSLKAALAMLVLLGVGHLFVPFVPDADKIPLLMVYGDVVLGAASLVAAFGLLKPTQWGLILTLIIAILHVLSSAPGLVAAPNAGPRVVTTVYLVVSLVIIALVALPSERTPAVHRTSAPQE
jgi:hypothetical protein